MRDNLDIDHTAVPLETQPLIPDPPIQSQDRVQQRSHVCHQCWAFFRRCSRWSCLIFTLMGLVLLLVLLRSLLPFGWPKWIPNIFYSSSDPHIFVIMADDLGWSDLGFSTSDYSTPAIENLYDESIQLNRFYVHQSGSASRAALLTGRFSYETGLQHSIQQGSAAHLPTEIQTLPQLLSAERGYATHLVGKWNLGYSKWEYTPTERGFDSFFGYHQSEIDYYMYTSEKTSDKHYIGYDLWQDKKMYTGVQYEYATKLFTTKLTDLIDSHLSSATPDQPLFVMYSPPNVHTPIASSQYSPECADLVDHLLRYKFCSMVQELDVSVNSLVTKLHEKEIWDRSMIVFLSDNGGLACYQAGDYSTCSGSTNTPLRAGKATLFDGGLRVRSFIGGGYIPDDAKGTFFESVVTIGDLFPTLAHAAHAQDAMATVSDRTQNWWTILTGLDSDTDSDTTGSDTTGDDQPNLFQYRSDAPLILELEYDSGKEYIYKAVLFYKNFKYIVSPEPAYDGWYLTPVNYNPVEDDGAGSIVVPIPLRNDDGDGDDDTLNDLDSNDDENFATYYHIEEYLFDLQNDFSETNNLVMAEKASARRVLFKMRNTLRAYIVSDEYYDPQENTFDERADPSLHSHCWHPYE